MVNSPLADALAEDIERGTQLVLRGVELLGQAMEIAMHMGTAPHAVAFNLSVHAVFAWFGPFAPRSSEHALD